jgi:hypothetical protein
MRFFFGRFLPPWRNSGHWMLWELILVNQLVPKVSGGNNAYKSKIAWFFVYGFYGNNRIIPYTAIERFLCYNTKHSYFICKTQD